MEKVKEIIDRKKRQVVGSNIRCRFCDSPQAYIRLEDGRYMVYCPVCMQTYYLKEQHK